MMNNKRNKNDFLVTGLSDIEPAFKTFDGTMYAGLLPFHWDDPDGSQGEFMFWLFEPAAPAADNTLGVYLSGGPGCSSIGTGNFFGTGPVGVPKFPAGAVDPTDKHGPLQENPFAYTRTTYMVYIEQPAPTGFSHGPSPDTEDDVARDLYQYLVNFFETFDHLKDRQLFLLGGSYSGMNVPALARKIHHENTKPTSNRSINMNLAGIALGNAWLDAKLQGPAAIDFAWYHGMIDHAERDTFHAYWQQCIHGGKVTAPMHPFNVPDDCGLGGIILEAAGQGVFEEMSPNPYDISTWDPYAVLEEGGTINKFYNNPHVQDALHVPRQKWQGCVAPGSMLQNDQPGSVVPYVAELLDEAKIRVVFYNGDQDLLCCHTGTDLLLESMQWSGSTQWKSAERGLWMVDDRKAGYTKELDNLTFVTIYNSGHMVYYNQPARTLDLITRFITGESLLDVSLPSYSPPEKAATTKKWEMTAGQVLLGLAAGAALFLAWRRIKRNSDRRREKYESLDNGSSSYQDDARETHQA